MTRLQVPLVALEGICVVAACLRSLCMYLVTYPHSFLPCWSSDDPAEHLVEHDLPAHVGAALQHLHVFLPSFPLQGLDVHHKK